MVNIDQSRNWLIMPALDEAENLKWLLPHLTSLYNVVVVDNGSRDNTKEIAVSLGGRAVDCKRRGYGSAVQVGLNYINELCSKDPIVVIFDSDGTSPYGNIPDLIKLIEGGKADFVIGQRTHLIKGSMPIHADFGNWLQTNLIGVLLGYFYKDMGPLRAMRLSTFLDLKLGDKTWGWNVEMQIKALRHRLKIEELGIEYQPRKFGHSKISGNVWGSIKAGSKIMFAVFYYYFLSLALFKEGIKPSIKKNA